MSGFYGKITNFDKSAFKFDKIYPNRAAMEANVENDGVFIGRYVLIDYHEIISGSNTDNYAANQLADSNIWGRRYGNWDSTVWQKVYVRKLKENSDSEYEQKVAYRFIADLNSTKPIIHTLENIPPIAPILTIGEEFNTEEYQLQIPKNWDFEGGNVSVFAKNETHNDNVWSGLTPYSNTGKQNEAEIIEESNSNYTYYDYNENNEIEKISNGSAEDTKVINFYLPEISKLVSDIWEIIYGPADEDTNQRQVPVNWNNVIVAGAGNGDQSIAGLISNVNALMGIADNILENVNSININTWDNNHIYKYNNEFYIKAYENYTTSSPSQPYAKKLEGFQEQYSTLYGILINLTRQEDKWNSIVSNSANVEQIYNTAKQKYDTLYENLNNRNLKIDSITKDVLDYDHYDADESQSGAEEYNFYHVAKVETGNEIYTNTILQGNSENPTFVPEGSLMFSFPNSNYDKYGHISSAYSDDWIISLSETVDNNQILHLGLSWSKPDYYQPTDQEHENNNSTSGDNNSSINPINSGDNIPGDETNPETGETI